MYEGTMHGVEDSHAWRQEQPAPGGSETGHRLTIAFLGATRNLGRVLWRPSDRSGSWRRTTPSPRRRSHTLDADDTTVGCDLVSAYGLSTGPSQRPQANRPPHAPDIRSGRPAPAPAASQIPRLSGHRPADRGWCFARLSVSLTVRHARLCWSGHENDLVRVLSGSGLTVRRSG